jgi:uncharacterized protein YjdB
LAEAKKLSSAVVFEAGDSIKVEAPDGFGATFTYDVIQAAKNFYPATTASATNIAGATAVGAVIALTSASADISTTASAAVEAALAGDQNYSGRFLVGLSEEDYLAGEAAGKRFVTAPSKITIIKKVPVTSVKLGKTKGSIAIGKSLTLKATVLPDNATINTITWKSSDDKIATVKGGVVTGVKAGTATITVTTDDGAKTATAVITVKPTLVSKVTISTKTASLAKGKSFTFKATVAPVGASNSAVKWTSSDPKVAKVNATTGKVTAKKVGTVKITATAKDGSKKKATVTVKVTNTPVKTIKFAKKTTSLKVGKTFTFKAVVTPAKASKAVTWTSSKTKIATINASGKVTAKKAGTTKITATAKDGTNKKVSVTLKVKAK